MQSSGAFLRVLLFSPTLTNDGLELSEYLDYMYNMYTRLQTFDYCKRENVLSCEQGIRIWQYKPLRSKKREIFHLYIIERKTVI